MDIQIDSTEDFEKEFQRFPSEIQERLSEKINYLISMLQQGVQIPKLVKVNKFSLPEGLTMDNITLYIYRATIRHRIILSIDDDPLFDQKIITLFSVIDYGKAEKVYEKVLTKIVSRWQTLRN